ncbi:hypothetical protein [Streptomyces sp. NPDC052114]|uniref:hypothetical protein n=1 Tax=unclassified Streptomyces TaxID=2593676 RepID=UPI0034296503
MAIRFSKEDHALIVDGTQISPCGLGTMYEYDECTEISLPELRRAIANLEGKQIPPLRSTPRRDGPVDMSSRRESALLESVTNNVVFCVRGDTTPDFIAIDVSGEGDMIASFFVTSDMADVNSMIDAISPHMKFRETHLLGYAYLDDPGPKIPPGWEFDILIPPRRLKMSAVRQLAGVIAEAVQRRSTPMNPGTVFDLCHGGAPDYLVGMEESDWLEVKSQGYFLDKLSDRIELAQDVARFANSEEGGILVVGYRTKKNQHGELISKFTPTREELAGASRYRSVIDARVFPPVDGLRVMASQQGDGWILTVLVPPQSEENKPFLVHGAIVDGKVEGAFISVVRRRGEASIPITGPAIHTMLAAGRALLRGRHSEN